MVEEGLAALHRAQHRSSVEPHEQQLGESLLQLEVGHALIDIRSREQAVGLSPVALDDVVGGALAVLPQQALLERAAKAERAAPVRQRAVGRVVERLAVANADS